MTTKSTDKPHVRQYADADLISQLLGQEVAGLKEALTDSTDLMNRFNELSHLDKDISEILRMATGVSDQDLVDVATGHASSNTRLLVSAHIRQNPDAKARLDALKREYQEILKESESRKIKLPVFLATPLSLAVGLRSNEDILERSAEGGYQSTELSAQISYRAIHSQLELFRLEGSVVHRDAPGVNLKIALCATGRRPRQELTKATGTFFFNKIRSGEYWLRITLPVGVMETPHFFVADE